LPSKWESIGQDATRNCCSKRIKDSAPESPWMLDKTIRIDRFFSCTCVYFHACARSCACMRMVCNLEWRLAVEQHAKTEHVSALYFCVHAGFAVARSLPRNDMCDFCDGRKGETLENHIPQILNPYDISDQGTNTRRGISVVPPPDALPWQV